MSDGPDPRRWKALGMVAATLSMIREKDIPAERLEEARVPA